MKRERDGKFWGDYETRRAFQMAEDGYSPAEIADALNRSERPVYQKLKENHWYKQPDGTMARHRAATKYGRREPAVSNIPSMEVEDYVNHKGDFLDGKPHPIMLAKHTLKTRINIIEVPNGGGKAIFLDGKLVTGADKWTKIMRETNKARKLNGEPQCDACSDWVVC